MKLPKRIPLLTTFFILFFIIIGKSPVQAEEYTALQCPPGTIEKKRGILSIDICYPTSKLSKYCENLTGNPRIEVVEKGIDDVYCVSPITEENCNNNKIAPRKCNNKNQARIPIYGVVVGFSVEGSQYDYKDANVKNLQTAFDNGYLVKSVPRYWCKSLKHYLDFGGTNQCYAVGDLVPNMGCYVKSGEDINGDMRLERDEVTIGDFTDEACTTKKAGEGKLAENVSVECEVAGSKEPGVYTAIGCLPTDPTGIVNWLSIFGFYAGGALVVFRIIQGSAQMMTAAGNPDKIQEARGVITSAIIGLLVLISGAVLLQFIGVTILGLDRFGFISILFD